jgi:hypothetical protein
MRPIVIFRKYDEVTGYDENDPENGEWGVSINGKHPEPEYFFGCKSKTNAKKVQEALIDYLIKESKLMKEIRLNIFKDSRIDPYDEYWKLTQPHGE